MTFDTISVKTHLTLYCAESELKVADMDKVWYIYIDDAQEGPFSKQELIADSRLTLDTLVWKEGFEDWVPLKKVNELRVLFEKQHPSMKPKEVSESACISNQDEIALDYGKDPNFPFLFVLLALSLLIYLIYQLYWHL